MRYVSILIAAATLSGCASDLAIFSDNQGSPRKIAGVPFRVPELFVQQGTYRQATKGGKCDPAPFVKVESLPLGELYFANIETATFAKSGFSMKFNEKGALSEISMNTEPSSGDALKNAGELIKAITPLTGVDAAALPGPDPACDTGPTDVKYIRFADWQAQQR